VTILRLRPAWYRRGSNGNLEVDSGFRIITTTRPFEVRRGERFGLAAGPEQMVGGRGSLGFPGAVAVEQSSRRLIPIIKRIKICDAVMKIACGAVTAG